LRRRRLPGPFGGLITEFIGVILIWIGYKYCLQPLDTTNMYIVM